MKDGPCSKMSLALDKCSQVVFMDKLQSMQLAGSILKSDIGAKYLGVMIDSKLSQIEQSSASQAKTNKKPHLITRNIVCRTDSLKKIDHYKSTLMPITMYELSCIHKTQDKGHKKSCARCVSRRKS